MKALALLLCLLLAGCASSPRERAQDLAPLLHDAAFAPPSEPVGSAGLFALSPAMRAYLKSPRFATYLRQRGSDQGLVDALYEKGELQIEYDSTMTRTAAQTYAARSGNCLSLVIMTAAFAKELGMPVRYQSVEVADTWSRQGGLYLVSSHVNLSLGRRATDLHGNAGERMLTIDFLPPQDMTGYRTRAIEERDIVAMYLNNRAAEALVQDRIDDAYWWARAAVLEHPGAGMAYNTLGVVHHRRGDVARAERALRVALELEPDSLAPMQNLLPLLETLGRSAEAQALAARIARLNPEPPYHFFDEGMKAWAAGDYRKAKALFAREVKRAPESDEFHLWLALAHLRLGETAPAREQLALARETSTRPDTRERYEAKLAQLKALGASQAKAVTR
jgi:tetratricopeptide (TPR) repeat protein